MKLPTLTNNGFIALIPIILLATGTLAFSFVNLSAASLYADSVTAREIRIQEMFNKKECEDKLLLAHAKDFFMDQATIQTEYCLY